MAKTYMVYNGPMVTTAVAAKVTTGTALKTMIQVQANANNALRITEWGVSFDGAALGTPGVAELLETGAVGGTVTAYVTSGIYPHNDPNAPASLIQIGSATASGYTCTSEGTVTATRMFDLQLVDPAVGYMRQFLPGREPEVKAGNYCRIRVTFGAAVNCLAWLCWEE